MCEEFFLEITKHPNEFLSNFEDWMRLLNFWSLLCNSYRMTSLAVNVQEYMFFHSKYFAFVSCPIAVAMVSIRCVGPITWDSVKTSGRNVTSVFNWLFTVEKDSMCRTWLLLPLRPSPIFYKKKVETNQNWNWLWKKWKLYRFEDHNLGFVTLDQVLHVPSGNSNKR